MSRRARGMGRQCEHVNPETGEQCRAWGLHSTFEDQDGPRCRIHALTPDELSREASRMARANAALRRAEVEATPRSGLDPGISLAGVLEVIRPALTATLPAGEADWSARLAAAGTLLAGFARYYRETPEKVNELLREAIPEEAYDERMNASRVYLNMRAEWDKLDGLRWSDLTGLYVKPYPAWMIGPHEEAAKVQQSRPKPISPARAEARIIRLPDGEVAIRRDGQLPRLLETG
jgi:hypothetical protein